MTDQSWIVPGDFGYNDSKKSESLGLDSNKKIPMFASSLEINAKVESGEISLKSNLDHYEKHYAGTKQYEAYRESRRARGWGPQSRLTISEMEVQKLIDSYHGTGIVTATRNGIPRNEELHNFNREIGFYVESGVEYSTTKGKIIYGKKGTHIVPIRGENYD